MPTPKASKPLTPVCTKMFKDDWKEFKELCGEGNANARLRELVAEDIKASRTLINALR